MRIFRSRASWVGLPAAALVLSACSSSHESPDASAVDAAETSDLATSAPDARRAP